MANEKVTLMPEGVRPRCLSKVQAAQYIGVSPNTFARMVANSEAPKPIQISQRRLVWDLKALDEFIDSLKPF